MKRRARELRAAGGSIRAVSRVLMLEHGIGETTARRLVRELDAQAARRSEAGQVDRDAPTSKKPIVLELDAGMAAAVLWDLLGDAAPDFAIDVLEALERDQ
jgi:hypothetical protein